MDNEKVIATPGSAPEGNDKKNKKEKKSSSVPFRIMKYFIAVVLVAVLAYFGFTCEVREGSCAVIQRFGAVRAEISDAGLYFKLPWPFESVVSYDNRLQYLESDYLETTTKDKRNIIIQSYVIWQIDDIMLYHNSVGSQGKVEAFVKDQVFSATNSVMGAYDLSELVSLDSATIKNEQIQHDIFERVRDNCKKNYGILVSDVSILRLSLPDTNLQSVFEQMKADRQKDIDTIVANAKRDANKITSDADAEAAKIRADGVNAAAAIRAETETEVARIYAEAQAANIKLYEFLTNLDTIVSSVGANTVLVVKADEYPFKLLFDYSDYLTTEGDATVVSDLEQILVQLDEADRKALTDAVYELINAAAQGK